jgi:hypothetical protein
VVRRVVRQQDRYRLRPWPDDDPTLLNCVAPQLEGFLKIVSMSIAQWKARGRINLNFKPVTVYTAELRTPEFPPALRSYPSYLGPSVIVVYHSPAECLSKPYARFLLYHEFGHLGFDGLQNRFANLIDPVLMFSILMFFSLRGLYYYAAMICAAYLVLEAIKNDGQRREVRADTYAAERAFRVSGVEALDHVISAFSKRCEDIRNDLWRVRVHRRMKLRMFWLGLQLHQRLANLKIQRDALSSTGLVCLIWDAFRVVPCLVLIVCAWHAPIISLWTLPIVLALVAVQMGLYYLGMGLFLGSIGMLEFVIGDNGPYEEA